MCFSPIRRPPKQGKILSLWETVGGNDPIGFLRRSGDSLFTRVEKFGERCREEEKERGVKTWQAANFLVIFSLVHDFTNFIVRKSNKLGYYPRFVLYTNTA